MKPWNRYDFYHPALNLPGTAQADRLPPVLAGDSPLIDDRQTSDFLNYFAALAHQINYYDTQLNVSDWGPFFSSDIPFLMSQLAATDAGTLQKPLAEYQRLFRRQPSVPGLQLLFLYTWYILINPIQNWASLLQGSNLPLAQTIQTLISGNLQGAIRDYIRWLNTAVHCFCIRRIDLTPLLQNTAWNLTESDLIADEPAFPCTGRSRRTQLLAVEAELGEIVGTFADVLQTAGAGAADQVNNQQQFYQLLQTTGQQAIRPHLALLYAFLDQYLDLLQDFNALTATQMTYTYQNVLQLSPGALQPDQAYIVFALQQQIPSYPLAAGLSLKDGKDANNADIYFQLTAPLTVTQTQATAFSTLFIDTRKVDDLSDHLSYVEGVYMAPDATKADGQTQAFTNPASASWATLGAKWSKYTPPGATSPAAYPTARLGFMLASKILLLNEGTRQIDMHVECKWGGPAGKTPSQRMVRFFGDALAARWLIVNQALIDQAVTMGVTKDSANRIRRHYLEDTCQKPVCEDDNEPEYLPYRLIRLDSDGSGEYHLELSTQLHLASYEAEIWRGLLVPQDLFTVTFSGAKGWITPDTISMEMVEGGTESNYRLRFQASLTEDQPAVTFYNAAALGETLGTTDPAVKFVLNDAIKVPLSDYIESATDMYTDTARYTSREGCPLEKPQKTCGESVSTYTFLRDLVVIGASIHVTVCNVKTLTVCNDDSALSATSPFPPFGVKPVVPDFDLDAKPLPHLAHANLVGPNFYVGSTEVFLKKWTHVSVKINWKGKPASFWQHYWAYMRFHHAWRHHFPRHEVNFAVQHNAQWHREAHAGQPPHILRHNHYTHHHNRRLFAKPEPSVTGCDNSGYTYSFEIQPHYFHLGGKLSYDPTFAPLDVPANTQSGYIRLGLENQDFGNGIYTKVMTERVMARVHHPWVPLPKEPWPAMISDMALDYKAHADQGDITMIQLYPYPNTYQVVDISGEPSLLPKFTDEGNLFIGLTGLVPGDGLSMLFQLAEGTANTEAGAGTVKWQYLANNKWQDLKAGFGVAADNTNGLSATGLVQYDFPDDISTGNTVMPATGYWVRASMRKNAASTSQTVAILAQAALAGFVYNKLTNDPTRPGNTPLPAGSISKLSTPDPNVSSVSQPYASFGGQAPETYNNAFTVRVSEGLRHKGRAIQTWDYERLVLAQFPQVLVAKCIGHSYALSGQAYDYDLPVAPGNLIVAVLPDPTKVTVADSQQPTVPMSVLTAIETFLTGIVSPFVKLFVCNPRYEPANICLRVSFQDGLSPAFYQTQLQQDIAGFLTPWLPGNSATATPAAMQFSQRLYRSDLVQFIGGLTYVAGLQHLALGHPGERLPEDGPDYIDPRTPRSILVPGKIVVRATHKSQT
jgi:hypothetical protein